MCCTIIFVGHVRYAEKQQLLRLFSLTQCGRKPGRSLIFTKEESWKVKGYQGKGLISKPEFKQQYFAPIQSIPQPFQLSCLAKVAEKEYSLEDLKKKAKEFRSMQTIQKAFCRCTNTVTWEEARDRSPHFTDSARLHQFLRVTFKPIPEAFQAFCQAALQNESVTNETTGEYCLNDSRAYVVQADSLLLLHTDLKKACPLYTAAHLVLAPIPKVCRNEDWTVMFSSWIFVVNQCS